MKKKIKRGKEVQMEECVVLEKYPYLPHRRGFFQDPHSSGNSIKLDTFL